MFANLQRSVLVVVGLQLGMTIGCTAETSEMPDEYEDTCVVEQADGTLIEAPCTDPSEAKLQTEGIVPGGCADPNQRCNDIEEH